MQAGLLPTALFSAAVVTMLATASFADRIGAKRMNVLGVIFSLASNLLFAAGPTYETLLLAPACTPARDRISARVSTARATRWAAPSACR